MSSGRLRVLKFPWHIGHDYELFKLPFEWGVLKDTSRSWASHQRPLPDHVRLVRGPDAKDFDLMILHVDQWILGEPEKLSLFEYWRDRFPGKIVVINHGCNLVDGCSSADMQSLLGDLPTVCNSSTAHRLWTLPNSRYVRHGMSPEEWPQTDYSLGNILVVQSFYGTRHKAYRAVDEVLGVEQSGLTVDWVGRDRSFEGFEPYRDYLAQSSIFLNPSHASPNPRTRTEAMLCGLAIVTTASHGETEYIEHGVNGFASDDLAELAQCLRTLQSNPVLTREMGRRGRETARDIFHIARFRDQWLRLTDDVMNGRRLS